MNKHYLVTLTASDRAGLRQRLAAGTGPARDLTHARILLRADASYEVVWLWPVSAS
jgi:hypothetical protein